MMRNETSTISSVGLESTNATILRIFSAAQTSTQSFATSVEWVASSSRSSEDSAGSADSKGLEGPCKLREGRVWCMGLRLFSTRQPPGPASRQRVQGLDRAGF